MNYLLYLSWAGDKLMELGNKLKTFRKKQHLSQSEFAECISSTQQSVSNYERGIVEPSIELLIRIAETFNCSIDELIGRPFGAMEQEVIVLLREMPEYHRTLSIQLLKTIHNIGPEGK